MVRPSALAVLRLMTSSNFVGCSTGRSAGLAPYTVGFRTQSCYSAKAPLILSCRASTNLSVRHCRSMEVDNPPAFRTFCDDECRSPFGGYRLSLLGPGGGA
jgi:hypothetical protein